MVSLLNFKKIKYDLEYQKNDNLNQMEAFQHD